ncbi:hypothetical protein JB92DRAFT_3083995 [Gautieria morchelliformis]|nr:hypothetical protein JB92DRAFT_3083995 [Gautieria morchelliformis]
MCDMVRSGELAKYPLAMVDRLLELCGPRLMIGYDIGCGFSATANQSSLLGPRIHAKECRFYVGSFHGHAHCRLCQLDWHPLYIPGCGLEDFEGCEHCFSESNAVASHTGHASSFHQKQAIQLHFQCWNSDKYAELSTFLYNNYRQALQILDTLPTQLTAAKKELKIPSDTMFDTWRNEEKEYLSSLKQEPEIDVLRPEYLRTLRKLHDAQ